MRLSIIIPTYNEEKYLPKLLDTIKRQTFRHYEIIIADAQSKDATREIAIQSGAHVVDGGLPGAARNRGAEAATGNLLLFLDADVILPHIEFLKEIVTEFEKKHLSAATCLPIPLSNKKIDAVFHGVYNVWVTLIKKYSPHAGGFCILATRRAHEKIGGFDEHIRLAEDHDYVKRASKIGAFDILTEKILVSVRRFDRDGRAAIAVKYLTCEAYLLMGGKVTTDAFKYRFGYARQSFDETVHTLPKHDNK